MPGTLTLVGTPIGNPDFIRETRALMKARGIVSPRLGKPGQLLVESLW